MAASFGMVSGTYFASETAVSMYNGQHDVVSHALAGAMSGGLLARVFGMLY
jgi:hypothetical protein